MFSISLWLAAFALFCSSSLAFVPPSGPLESPTQNLPPVLAAAPPSHPSPTSYRNKSPFVSATAALSLALVSMHPFASVAAPKGEQLFVANCAACHIQGGNIIPFNGSKTLKLGDLKKNKFDTEEAIAKLIVNGAGVMPKYAEYKDKDGTTVPAKLSDAEIKAVSAYTLEKANAGWQ
ncbi:unnamed protein product [Chrysoparadoxa australica]